MRQRRPLFDENAIHERLARIDEPHVRDLNQFVREIRREHPNVPYFDPDGGGAQACVLLLLSDPGRSGAQITNIASVDNQDKTARNTLRLLGEAKLDPCDVLNWNIVPWATVDADPDVDAGAGSLRRLLKLLPELRVVVPMGTRARSGWRKIRAHYPHLRTYDTSHPAQREGEARELGIVEALRGARLAAGLAADSSEAGRSVEARHDEAKGVGLMSSNELQPCEDERRSVLHIWLELTNRQSLPPHQEAAFLERPEVEELCDLLAEAGSEALISSGRPCLRTLPDGRGLQLRLSDWLRRVVSENNARAEVEARVLEVEDVIDTFEREHSGGDGQWDEDGIGQSGAEFRWSPGSDDDSER